jgi:hypothetical protein
LRSLLLRELKTLPLRHQHTGTLGWVISTARHAPLTMNFVDSLTYASGLIFFFVFCISVSVSDGVSDDAARRVFARRKLRCWFAPRERADDEDFGSAVRLGEFT